MLRMVMVRMYRKIFLVGKIFCWSLLKSCHEGLCHSAFLPNPDWICYLNFRQDQLNSQFIYDQQELDLPSMCPIMITVVSLNCCVTYSSCREEERKWYTYIYIYHLFIFIYLFFRERGREGGREGEKHQCVVVSHMSPTGDLACNPGTCPDVPCRFTGRHSIH